MHTICQEDLPVSVVMFSERLDPFDDLLLRGEEPRELFHGEFQHQQEEDELWKERGDKDFRSHWFTPLPCHHRPRPRTGHRLSGRLGFGLREAGSESVEARAFFLPNILFQSSTVQLITVQRKDNNQGWAKRTPRTDSRTHSVASTGIEIPQKSKIANYPKYQEDSQLYIMWYINTYLYIEIYIWVWMSSFTDVSCKDLHTYI